jgi:hypothetical protein
MSSDTIYKLPGAIFTSELENAETGLLGTLGVRILAKLGGEEVVARHTDGIAEDPAGSGRYVATLTAPTRKADYSIFWDAGTVSPLTTASDDLVVTTNLPELPASEVEWAPTVEEVAALIRARTKIPGGREAGTFNDNTRPTRGEVETLLGQAVDHVSAAVGGDPCNERLKQSAQAAAAMLAAILIETSYWPEQAEARGSAAARLESLYERRMKSLTASVAEECGGQGTGDAGEGNAGAVAAGGFSDGLPLIGRDYPPRW